MHWLAWKKLCRHKREGGLGFRTIEDFNTALLAKQLWRLMDYPDSLFAKSIISARSLVNKGLIKRVGSGSSISVWYDPWISDSRPRSAICIGVNYYPHLRVSELINTQTSTWNLPLLQQLFESTEVARITGITISTGLKPDRMDGCSLKQGDIRLNRGIRSSRSSRTWRAHRYSDQTHVDCKLSPGK
ncbi:unnamed protein product [Microthlaspi erraticum]|uniref:Reverse transcriptase zinc-binding domain-containing protein n=1 Tax=Microthlaspi erraticum TaxID=1685480 RepID=A0A6D2HK91_9BRAS|nr:unnamed protein product [Microthlaspi erraticum]